MGTKDEIKMPQYVLVSFDFGGTVKVHCVTKSEAIGRSMYAAVADRHRDTNRRASDSLPRVLVELVEMPDEFSSSDGRVLFWGPEKPILSNNA